jgi:hypothetical protein
MFCAWFCTPRKHGNAKTTSSTTLDLPVVYIYKNRKECVLLSACWNEDWDKVRRRCRTHRREAFYRTVDSGRTALHLASMPGARAPGDVIEMLIECNPHALLLHDKHCFPGTPLHFLCWSVHGDNLRLMRKAVLAALEMTKQHPLDQPSMHAYSPLFLASNRGASAEALELLIQGVDTWISPFTGCETGVLKRDVRWNPLHSLWSVVREHLQSIDEPTIDTIRTITASILSDRHQFILSATQPNHNMAVQSWLKLLVLFRSAIVHSNCLTLLELLAKPGWAIPALFRLACTLFPEQIVACSSSGTSLLQTLLNREDWRPASSNRVARMLLEVVELCPGLLLRLDECSGLYPFALAAVRGLSLDCVYSMLVASPHVLLTSHSQ